MKPGDLISDRYRLLRPIGAGATGTVWAARHEHLGREYALKFAATGGLTTRDARERFLREVRIVGTLRHRNIVDIADAGETGSEGLYLAMELLDGESLAERVARAPLAPSEALAVIAEVCRGLAAAHAAGIVHRDIKPENIFLARGPTGGVVPKLLDFGVSSTRDVSAPDAKSLYGTPAYMSPEQALGETAVDPGVDLWAVGVVLYEMLTGRHPFEAESYLALLPIIIESPCPPLPASIPAEVAAIVARCLAKPRADRHASAEALLEAVERARAALPEPEPGSTRSGFFIEVGRDPPAAAPISDEPKSAPSRVARPILAAAIIAGVVAVGALAATMGARRDPPPSAASATSVAPIVETAAPPATQTATAPASTADATPSAVASAQTIPARAPGLDKSLSQRKGPMSPSASKPRVTKVDKAGF